MILNKYKKKKVIKSSIVYIFGNFLTSGFSFLFNPIFIRSMSKSDLGTFNNFIAWTNILNVICTFQVDASINRAIYDFKDDTYNYCFSALLFSFINSILCFFIFLCFFKDFVLLSDIYIYIMFINSSVYAAINVLQIENRVKYKYIYSFVLTIILLLTQIFLTFILLFCIQNKGLARILGNVIPNVCINIYVYFIYWKKSSKISFKYFKYIFYVCLPYIPHVLSRQILGSCGQILIFRFYGAKSLAMYSIAYSISSIFILIASAIYSSITPYIFENLHTKNYINIKQINNIILLLVVTLMITVTVFMPDIIYFYAGVKYMKSLSNVLPILLGFLFQYIYYMYVCIEQFELKTIGMAIGTIFAAIFNYIGNFILIPVYGYTVVPYIMLLSNIILSVFHFYLVRKIFPNFNKIIDNKFIFFFLFLTIFFSYAITCTYTYSYFKYILFIIFTSIVCFTFIKTKNFYFFKD